MKKTIFINLGNKGIILSVKSGKKILDSVFFQVFNQTTLPDIEAFFRKYSRSNVYIILDTIAQNYNYKLFPNLGFFDLQSLANRRFKIEVSEEDLKFKKFLYKREKTKQNLFLFVSANTDSPLKEWLNFLDTIPNNVLGIYMLPYECAEFCKKIIKSIGAESLLKEKNRWILLMVNDRVSDLRQVAIFNGNIAFTRLISIDNIGGDIGNYSKKDIIRTSEYIKRFDSDFTFEKLTFISILDQENKEKLEELKLDKALIFNFTPNEVADKLKMHNIVAPEERYSDLLIGNFILGNRNRKRLGTKYINLLSNISLGYKIFKNIAILLAFGVVIGLGGDLFSNFVYQNDVINLRRSIRLNKENKDKRAQELFGMEVENFEKIIDASVIRSVLINNFKNPTDYFMRFNTLQKGIALTYALDWSILDFDYQRVNYNNNIRATYNVSILNESGDPNALFDKYDILVANLKKSYSVQELSYSAMPSNIDFSKKYYFSNIKIDIIEKQGGGQN